jgi:flagellar hook assembly protein FlgD
LRTLALTLTAAVLAAAGLVAPIATPAPAQAATGPKVAIIVGATHSATAKYRDYGNQVAATALKYTSNVVKVFSPNATWSKVKAAVNGASIVVYLGHGNGWPSPYTYDANYTTKDGFGLNADLNNDGKLSDYENKYYGEPSIRTLTPAKNAVVLLFHLCYASGNSEPGDADPTLTTAKKRVDNYGAAFIQAGARAVVANGHSHNPYYIDALFTTKQTLDQYWRNAPDFNNAVRTYESTRNPGYTYQLDPESGDSYYRSIVGKMTLTTTQVTGAAFASTSGDPASFVVPGNASPAFDGAPLYGTPESAAAGGFDQQTDLLTTAKVRILSKAWFNAADGSAVFQVHTADGADGWMRGSTLLPRDSSAPRVWEADEGLGVFSPNGDGTQDTWTLTLGLSEPAAWTLRIRDGNGNVKAHTSGNGDTAAMTWAPSSGSVNDGTYRWEIEATDGWDNGPLEADGTVKVDTQAPALSLADADAADVPSFAPNGDGYRETVSFSGTANEPGSLVAKAIDDDDDLVDSFSTALSGGAGTLTWNGRTSDGFAADGRYTISVRAKDIAGNLSAAQTRTVDLYAALGFVTSSRTVFFPQDGDGMAKTTTFSMRLLSPATVTWTVVDRNNDVVRTLVSDEAMGAGTHAKAWDGRTDGGAFVPRGTYSSRVSVTDGTQVAVQRVAVVADAFRWVVSDSTPGRGQKVTVTIVTPEPMLRNPRIALYQPGISRWSVSTTKLSSTTYRVTFRFKSSKSGTVRIKAYGRDKYGQSQSSSLYLPLH